MIALLTALFTAQSAPIVVQSIQDAKTFCARIVVRGGSAYESADESGVYHMLEHSMLTPELDSKAESVGCRLNGTTYREFMVLTAEGPANRWQEGVECLLLSLQFSLADSRLAIEKQIIAEEIALQDRALADSFERAAWKASLAGDSAWSRRSSGESKSVPTLTAQQVEAAFSKSFTRANMVLSVAGPVEEGDVQSLAAAALSRLPEGARLSPPPLALEQPASTVSHGPLVGRAFGAPGVGDINAYAQFATALAILADSLSANEACVEVFDWFGPSEGGSIASIAVRGQGVPPPLEVLYAGVQGLSSGVPDRFQRVRARLIAAVETASLEPSIASLLAGVGSLWGRPRFIEDYLQALSATSAADVAMMAKRLSASRAQ